MSSVGKAASLDCFWAETKSESLVSFLSICLSDFVVESIASSCFFSVLHELAISASELHDDHFSIIYQRRGNARQLLSCVRLMIMIPAYSLIFLGYLVLG